MHLKQLSFTYSACGPFTKDEERIKKFMQTENTDFIHKNELDKDRKNKKFSKKNTIR